MRITSKVETTISRVHIHIGTRNYRNIDSHEPMVALQLATLRDCGLISFDEILEFDNVRKDDKGSPDTGKKSGGDTRKRRVSDKKTNKSTGRSKVPKRRNRDNKTSAVCGEVSEEASSLGDSDFPDGVAVPISAE